MMAEDRTARPVSGEIMTGPAPASEHLMRGPGADIIDADYEVLPRFAATTEAMPSPQPRSIAAPSIEGMDMLRKPEAAPGRLTAARGGPIFWIAGVGAALAAFWVSGGHALVRQTPYWAAAQPAGTTLRLSGITSRVDDSGPTPILFVDGEAANDGAKAAQLPALEIRVTGNDSHITRYRLGTSDRSLAPGERFGFASRLDLPRSGVRTVSVAFAD